MLDAALEAFASAKEKHKLKEQWHHTAYREIQGQFDWKSTSDQDNVAAHHLEGMSLAIAKLSDFALQDTFQ